MAAHGGASAGGAAAALLTGWPRAARHLTSMTSCPRCCPELTDADRQLIDQRIERFLADGDLGLAADSVLAALEQSL